MKSLLVSFGVLCLAYLAFFALIPFVIQAVVYYRQRRRGQYLSSAQVASRLAQGRGTLILTAIDFGGRAWWHPSELKEHSRSYREVLGEAILTTCPRGDRSRAKLAVAFPRARVLEWFSVPFE